MTYKCSKIKQPLLQYLLLYNVKQEKRGPSKAFYLAFHLTEVYNKVLETEYEVLREYRF